jgi:hypothetical protein
MVLPVRHSVLLVVAPGIVGPEVGNVKDLGF